MRLILIGQAAFAEKVLDGLREHGHDIAAIYCPPERAGAKPDPVKVRGEALGISVRQHKSLRGAEVQKEFEDLAADLGVLAYVTQIVPQNVIDVPRLGCICFHPSMLPKYRGGSAIPWQIIKGETRTGVTVFWTDPGIDTGPILLQKEAAIGPDETAASLYYNSLFQLGVDVVLESVDRVAAGTAPKLVQDLSLGNYDPLLTDEHARVDWSRPVTEVYNLIRGCDPNPGAYVERDGQKVRLFDARHVDRTNLAPGMIAEIGEAGIVVGAGGGAIRVGKMRAGEKKVSAAEAAGQLQLSSGQTL